MKHEPNEQLKHVIDCDAAELTERIHAMSARECETYARLLLDELGGPTFEKYLAIIADTMMPQDGSGPPTEVDAYYLAVRDLFPHITTPDDQLGRLCAIVVQLCHLHLNASRNADTQGYRI